MKSKIILSITIVLALAIIGGAVVMIIYYNRCHDTRGPEAAQRESENSLSSIGEFDAANYQWEIENFSSPKNVGQANDVNTVIEKAKELWVEKYGTVNGQSYDPIDGSNIEAFFDKDNDCWLLKTTLQPNTKGSVPHAIIHKDGTVLAVWMG